MLMFLVFSLLTLQCVLGTPVEESDYEKWVASRSDYGRDFDLFFDRDKDKEDHRYFDNWFRWFGGSSSNKKKEPTIQQRVQLLENRQKALFYLIRCESYGVSDCTVYRTKAETAFNVKPMKARPGKAGLLGDDDAGGDLPAEDVPDDSTPDNVPVTKSSTVSPSTSSTTTAPSVSTPEDVVPEIPETENAADTAAAEDA